MRLHKHHLGGGGNLYMRRWILHTSYGDLRIHNICRSDQDRHLHDHPFDFWSLLIKGSYYEEIGGARLYWPWLSLIKRKASDLHRLSLPTDNKGQEQPVWTLVWTGPHIRDWGFQTEKGWVYWREYLRC